MASGILWNETSGVAMNSGSIGTKTVTITNSSHATGGTGITFDAFRLRLTLSLGLTAPQTTSLELFYQEIAHPRAR